MPLLTERAGFTSSWNPQFPTLMEAGVLFHDHNTLKSLQHDQLLSKMSFQKDLRGHLVRY